MAIVPERVGTEINVTDKASVPTVKVADVEVGEMFSRTIEYRYIRPTILGHGVQTPSFGWIFTGELLDASVKRMFAVIGVPKGTKEITDEIPARSQGQRDFCDYVVSQLGLDWPDSQNDLMVISARRIPQRRSAPGRRANRGQVDELRPAWAREVRSVRSVRHGSQLAKRKCITSPSATTYSLPSSRNLPLSRAPASPLPT